VTDDADTVVLPVLPTTEPADPATARTLERIRSLTPDGVAVTGPTALVLDLDDQLRDTRPLFIGAILLASVVLLMIVFRSVTVPLKAAVMNLLSIGAAYGVVVAVFQWGWLGGLFGLEGTYLVASPLPVIFFAVLFGLSMDYEMVCVFLSFVTDPSPFVQMIGLGLATAIALDATVVRMVLVPATMALLGRANWWLPGWLDRLLPHLDLDGGRTTAAPHAEPVPGLASTGPRAAPREDRRRSLGLLVLIAGIVVLSTGRYTRPLYDPRLSGSGGQLEPAGRHGHVGHRAVVSRAVGVDLVRRCDDEIARADPHSLARRLDPAPARDHDDELSAVV
jgi:hypothetical protein